MLTSYFFNPGMLAGAALVSLPIIIHLLHRLRTRRVRWAAIDFLLESERRNRRRLLFEQLLLLLMRCSLVLLFVLIIARPKLGTDLAALLGSGERTEHVVLLDDSYSMAEQVGQQRVFDHAVAVVQQIGQRLSEMSGEHHLTVMRTSLADQPPEMSSLRVDAASASRLQAMTEDWQPSHLATSPAPAVRQAVDRLQQSDAARRFLYLVSDYRLVDWREESLPAALREIADQAEIRLVDVGGQESPNAAVEALTYPTGAVAANVPFPVSVTVRNHSDEPLNHLSVEPFVDQKPLPARIMEAIPPRSTGELQVQVTLQQPGPHEVRFRIADDALAADNQRSATINLQAENPVLLVDDSADRMGSRFLKLALAPGGDADTGLTPQVYGLERLTSGSLDEFRGVYLVDFSSLTPAQAEALGRYVRNGGGVALFLGKHFDPQRAAAWLGDQENALLPIPISPPIDIAAAGEDGQWVVDLNHPVFEIFAGDRNPFLRTVQFSRLFSTGPVGEFPENVKVIARTRDGAPVALEATLGEGRVFVFLSSCGPDWNNWCRNPSFVVSMLELNAHLAETSADQGEFVVGDSWVEEFPLNAFRRRVEFTSPSEGEPFGSPTDALVVEGELQGTGCVIRFDQTRTPGMYLLAKTRTDGAVERTGRSYNVQAQQGDLRRIDEAALRDALAGAAFEYYSAEGLAQTLIEPRVEPRDWLLAAFVMMLFAEQWLAWRLSYHLS